MSKEELQGEINALISLLKNTDYKALKYAEGAITDADYNAIKAQRQAWRARINEIEAIMAEMEESEA